MLYNMRNYVIKHYGTDLQTFNNLIHKSSGDHLGWDL